MTYSRQFGTHSRDFRENTNATVNVNAIAHDHANISANLAIFYECKLRFQRFELHFAYLEFSLIFGEGSAVKGHKDLGHANCPPPWHTFARFYTQKEQCKKLPFFERVFSRLMKLGVQNTFSTLLLHDD